MLTMTDLFCGAGGSSTGATSLGGIDVRLAANHWDLAIETHNANHPNTDHLQADISNTDPRYLPSTDILWASPECTNHSRAKGRKALGRQPDLFEEVLPDEAAERSRATMWDVVRFTEAHGYKAIIVENVVEVADWSAPWGEKGGLFQAWLGAMHSMGYRHRIISLNSMHAQAFGLPAPQSRDRVYIAFWRAGDRVPDFDAMLRPKAWCASCDELVDAMQVFKRGDGSRPGRYRSQYVYRCPRVACRNAIVEPAWLPASSIIDWSNPGTRIGDRTKPLAEKTMRRIQAGIDRYWGGLMHVEQGGNQYDAADPKHPGFGDPGSYYRAWSGDEPLRTMHTRESKAWAYSPLAVPVEGREGKQPTSMEAAMRTMTTRSETGVAMPPFLTQFRDRVRDLDPTRGPLPTVVADGANHGLVSPPFIAELRGGGSTARAASDPLATVTASGNHHALVTRMNGGGAEMTTPVGEPVRTITTAGHQALLDAERPTVAIEDVMFRMLEPLEIQQAMAFPKEYRMAGNRREQVKLSGNAVTPPAARDLVATVAAALGGAA